MVKPTGAAKSMRGICLQSGFRSGQRCPAVRVPTYMGNFQGGTISTKAGMLDYYREQVAVRDKDRKVKGSGKKGGRWSKD